MHISTELVKTNLPEKYNKNISLFIFFILLTH